MIGRLLCLVGLHRWRHTPDQLGSYGMGLEWFECWECERCPATADQLRRGGSYQVHKTRERSERNMNRDQLEKAADNVIAYLAKCDNADIRAGVEQLQVIEPIENLAAFRWGILLAIESAAGGPPEGK